MAKSNPRRAIIREWTSLACEKRQSPTGERFCGRRSAAPPSATHQTSAARRHHGMAASAHRTALKITQRADGGSWRVGERMRSDRTRSLKSAEVIVRLPILMIVLVRLRRLPASASAGA